MVRAVSHFPASFLAEKSPRSEALLSSPYPSPSLLPSSPPRLGRACGVRGRHSLPLPHHSGTAELWHHSQRWGGRGSGTPASHLPVTFMCGYGCFQLLMGGGGNAAGAALCVTCELPPCLCKEGLSSAVRPTGSQILVLPHIGHKILDKRIYPGTSVFTFLSFNFLTCKMDRITLNLRCHLGD